MLNIQNLCKNSYLVNLSVSALKTFLYFGKRNFSKTELCSIIFILYFSRELPNLKNQKNPHLKSLLYFWKWNIPAPSLKKIIFRRNIQSLKIKQTKSARKTFPVFLFHNIKHLYCRVMKVVFLLHND